MLLNFLMGGIMRCFLRTITILLACWMDASAQTLPVPTPAGLDLKPQDQLHYFDAVGRDWVFMQANPDHPLLIQFEGRKYQIPSPVVFGIVMGVYPTGSALWACVIEEPPSGARMVAFRWDLTRPKETTGGWERIGEFESGHGLPSLIVPLGQDGVFLGVSLGMGFVGDDRAGASLVARFRLRDGIFRFEDCVEMTLEGLGNIAKHVPNPKESLTVSGAEGQKKDEPSEPALKASCEIDPPILRPSLWPPSVSRDHLALCAAQAGVIWVFELNKGRLRRTYNLDGYSKDELKKVGLMGFSVLGTAFDPNGRLIVAKRDPKLARIAVKVAEDTSEPLERKLQEEDFRLFTDLYKDIRWLALDPEVGTQREIDSSEDHPTITPSFRKQTWLRFLVTPQGQVKTNAYANWEWIKRDLGIYLDPPLKKDQADDAKPPKSGVNGERGKTVEKGNKSPESPRK